MAHFILEYSDNIDLQNLNLQALFTKLHQSGVDSGLFPLKGIRSRAYAAHDYRMADGNPQHIFMHLSVLVGRGRSIEERELAAKGFFDIFEAHFSHFFKHGGVAMSFEMRELEPVLKYNKNNIQDYL
jgi:5-carboxymethyl-2-hydroxymuconate isomerase